MVGVLIVDDQPFFRGAARAVVGAMPGFHAVGEASSGRQAIAAVDELRPDLVIVDVRMPGMDGMQTTRHIKARHPETVVILVSVEEDALPSSGRGCGAEAVVHKREFGAALLHRVWLRHGDGPRAVPRQG